MAYSKPLSHPQGILLASTRQGAVTDSQSRRFYWLFVLCFVLVSLPVKNLAYVVPPLYLSLQFLAGDRSTIRVALVVLACFIVSIISVAIDHLGGQSVNIPGVFMAMLTYLPFFFFLVVRQGRNIDENTFSKLISFVSWFVIVQSMIGYFQYAMSRNADAVTGTFGLFDFYFNTISIIQVYYTCNLFCMILFLMLQAHRPLVKVAIAAGLLACVLAQSGHQTIFFLACFSFFSIIQLRRIGTAISGAALVGMIVLAIMQVYPNTWEQTLDWYDKTVNNEKSPKRMVVIDSTTILSSPKNMVLGTGTGQYCSRAALITSNEYLNRKLPAIATGKSDYFVESILPAMEQFKLTGEGSAISKPYFSALSIIVEFGFPLALIFMLVFLVKIIRNLRWMLSSSPQVARIGLVCCVGLLFTLLCCLIENYLEFPQAIFLPLLLYLLVQARAENLLGQQKETLAGTGSP